MNDYAGKKCPFCKTEFKLDDEIVVCSECDMPHHKDCWIENQGCTTFGCMGTIKSVDNIATSVTSQHMNFEEKDFMFCTRCGTQNADDSLFCSKCGSRLKTSDPVSQTPVGGGANPVTQNPYMGANQNPYANVNQNPYMGANQNPYANVNQNAYTNANQYTAPYRQQTDYSSANYNVYQNTETNIDEGVILLVGKNSEYYVPKFQEMKTKNRKDSWNWSAFLFAPYWLVYRQMYAYGLIFLVVSLLTSFISTYLSVIPLAGCIVFGILGNNIYMNSLEKKSAKMSSMEESERSRFAHENSGGNTTATVLAIVGYMIAYAVGMALFIGTNVEF